MNPQDNTVHIVQPMDVQHPATSAFQPVLQGVGDFANNLVMIPTSIVQGFNQAGGTASIFNPLNNAFSPLKDSFTPLTDAVANPLAGANAVSPSYVPTPLIIPLFRALVRSPAWSWGSSTSRGKGHSGRTPDHVGLHCRSPFCQVGGHRCWSRC